MDLPLREFVERVGQELPAPGGGAAAGLATALAIALGRKVLAMARHDGLAADPQQALAEALAQLDRLAPLCGALIDEDIAACQAYVAAVQRSGAPPASTTLQATARLAVAVPLEIAAVAARLLSTLGDHRQDLSAVLHAEVAAAACLAEAACHAACEHARMIAVQLDPQEDRDEVQMQCRRLQERAGRLRAQILSPPTAQP